MKRALFITLIAPPYRNVGADRILRFIKYLPKFNWSADILSTKSKKLTEYDSSNEHKIPPDVKFYKASLLRIYRPISGLMRILPRNWYNFIAGFFMIPDAFIGCLPFFYFKGKKLLGSQQKPYDVLISSSPPHSLHLVCLLLKRKFKLPWAADFRDPWVGNPLHRGLTIFHKKLYQFFEYVIIKNCDLLIANTNKNKQILVNRYPEFKKKIICINNGYDPDDFHTLPASKDNKYFTLLYGGTLHPAYNSESLFRGVATALARCPELRNIIKVVLLGSKSEQRKISKYHLEGIVCEEPGVSHSEYLKKLKSCDVALLTLDPLNKNTNVEYWVPAKLYQYLGAHKPILGIVPEGEAKNILLESHLGHPCDPQDIDSISGTIIKLYKMWLTDGLKHDKFFCLDKYSVKNQTGVLADQLNKLRV